MSLAQRIPAARTGSIEVRPRRRAADAVMSAGHDPKQVIARTFREESGRILATLIRLLGDFDLAEEAMQDAFARCRRAVDER